MLRRRRWQTLRSRMQRLRSSRLRRTLRLNRYFGQRLGWTRFAPQIARMLGSPTPNPSSVHFARAVAQWQRHAGFPVSGVISPAAWKFLRRRVIGVVPSAATFYPPPMPEPGRTPPIAMEPQPEPVGTEPTAPEPPDALSGTADGAPPADTGGDAGADTGGDAGADTGADSGDAAGESGWRVGW